MSIDQIAAEALRLPPKDRATLVLSLMHTLTAPGTDVSDEEVARRDAELESGAVAPMLHEEFVKRVQDARLK